ncbi:response regulator [Sulfurospirillum sp. 1612]|uniref:response regulator n=1 Tax=Sulfurospirillum sp. 1612 TaxID=3094835 RepID=UPI002F9473D8
MDKGLTILAVDDDIINLKLIHSMLKKHTDIESVIEATNGLDALNIVKETENINLILLDIKMPVMDGIEFMENISLLPEKHNIPIIVLTTDETKKHQSFESGAFDFLVKPIREHELYEKILKIKNLL